MLSAYVELCLHNDLMGGIVSQGDGEAVACFSGKIHVNVMLVWSLDGLMSLV